MDSLNVKQSVKPFVLKQHEKDAAKVRELVDSELDRVTGGTGGTDRLKLSTMKCVGGSGCSDDGPDEG